MNPHIPLYQFTHEGDEISRARISAVQINPSPRDGQQRVTVDLRIEEDLWGGHQQPTCSYLFDRPANEIARVKFPDPVWGRTDLQSGTEVLLVIPPPGPSVAKTQNPVYVESIRAIDDPVFRSIREVLSAERERQTAEKRRERLLGWLYSSDVVRKLFAAEALAKGGPENQMTQLVPALARAFAEEADAYTKISLGTWLWNDIYPRATSQESRVVILNATIAAASSPDQNVRRFALDRLSEADPDLLARPGVQPSNGVIALLEQRRKNESDAAVRENLDRIIKALRR